MQRRRSTETKTRFLLIDPMGLKTLVIVGGHQHVIEIHPGPRYMLGWRIERLHDYALRHGWTIHEL